MHKGISSALIILSVRRLSLVKCVITAAQNDEAKKVDRHRETGGKQRESKMGAIRKALKETKCILARAGGRKPEPTPERCFLAQQKILILFYLELKNKTKKQPTSNVWWRTLTSSLWLMDRAECSSALMTDAYESENLVYFPTRAMEHCSSSRSDLHRETFNVQHSRFMLCDVIVCAKQE